MTILNFCIDSLVYRKIIVQRVSTALKLER